jgi:hypothetical protein
MSNWKSDMKFQMGSRSGVLSDISWIIKSKTLFFSGSIRIWKNF